MAVQLALFELQPNRSNHAAHGHRMTMDTASNDLIRPSIDIEGSFDYLLNPFSECSLKCAYCFGRYLNQDSNREATRDDWNSANESAVKRLASMVELPGSRVLIGAKSDPYQPAELRIGRMREILSLMVKMVPQPRLVIRTRSPLVVRDVDILSRFERVTVEMIIPTDDENLRKKVEPTSPCILRRFQALKMLRAARVETSVSISPMLPVRDPESFVARIRSVGVTKISVSPAGSPWGGSEFDYQRLQRAISS